MAKTKIINSLFITYIATLLSLITMSKSDPLADGFSIDLIHRDSPQSPFYDPSLTLSQRIHNALERSYNRIHRFKRSKTSPESDIISAGGEYLMKYSVGTPPVSSLAIADTGSDLIWNQCPPCLKCFHQRLPFFKPNASATYRKIPCNSLICQSLQDYTFCSNTRKNCLYAYSYGDGSVTQGELAVDTITFSSSAGKRVPVSNIVLGCGFRNGGIFSGVESGIVGLGNGQASLIRQLGPLVQWKFSYCFVVPSDNAKPSKLHFGAKAKVSGRGVVSTPTVGNSSETNYYLTLRGISIGNHRVEFYNSSSSNSREGNIIIDSGTTYTLLPRGFYDKVVKELKSRIKLKQINDPTESLDLCYSSREDVIKIPEIIVHFKGADVKWKQENAFIRTGDDAVCFGAGGLDGDDDVPIYGNLAQVNFLVGYDLKKKKISFKATDCGRN